MSRHAGLLALFTIALAAVPLGAGPDPDAAATLTRLAGPRPDAARQTYGAGRAHHRERRAPEEALYRWSVRWLDAERQLSDKQADQVAACKAHLERMRELERLLEGLRRSGTITVDEASAAEFYRVEAEIWLTQAKDDKKKP